MQTKISYPFTLGVPLMGKAVGLTVPDATTLEGRSQRSHLLAH